jgi:hypothetical protein
MDFQILVETDVMVKAWEDFCFPVERISAAKPEGELPQACGKSGRGLL